MTGVPRPFPQPDRDSAPFWEAQRRHRLVFQKCTQCGAFRYPVGPLCPRCRSFESAWAPSAGRGTVHSYTIVHHQTHPAFPVPYSVLLVEMDEGPRVVAQLRASPDSRPVIGDRVRVEWEDHPHQPLPVFVFDE